MKLSRAFLAGLIFIFLLLLVYYLHVAYFSVNVVFYAAIADAVIATVLTGALLFVLPYFRVFNPFEKILLAFIFLLLGYSFAISVPTVIDRSLSFYILEKIQQRGGGIRLNKFEEVFTKEYVKEHRLVDVRLTEQEESGTISIHNGCVKITDKGKRLAAFSRFFRQHFLPKKRLLMGQYTDDLTDPFRNSIQNSDYQCQ